jgi:Fic family protein
MPLYWPAFDFYYLLDLSRLLPHVAAIEACHEAAATRVLPPPWREQSVPAETKAAQLGASDEKSARMEQIRIRKERLQITNASQAQAWVRQRFVPGSMPLTLDDILTMHRMVSDESGVHYERPGALRNSGFQIFVGRPEVGGIHFGAPEVRLKPLMEEYVRFATGSNLAGLPPIIHALVAHFFFTTIHPFDDGNGRVSRLVSAAILFQRGYNGHGLHALSNHFYQHDIEYHTLLHKCWQKPLPFDLTEFVAFGIEGLVVELQGINNFIKVKLHRSAERAAIEPMSLLDTKDSA